MWNFDPGSFGSFALLLRENIFTLCLSPFQNYIFEIVDARNNGLISNLGTEVFGSFTLIYENQIVTTYHGNCEEEKALECGEYCRCSYTLLAQGAGFTGGCSGNSTQCDADSNLIR